MRPSIGRIVIVSRADEPLPAIVTRVYSDTCVRLTVYEADGTTSLHDSVQQGDGLGEWDWPARVEAAPTQKPTAVAVQTSIGTIAAVSFGKPSDAKS